MLRKILLIFLCCGLTVASVVVEYHASAAGAVCEQPRAICVPDVKPPVCEKPDCQVMRPLLRVSCAPAWWEHFRETVRRSPQLPCFVFETDQLQTVARVSTHNIMRAMSR